MKSESSSILETFDVSIEQENTSITISEVEGGQIFAFWGDMMYKNLALRALDMNSNFISECGVHI